MPRGKQGFQPGNKLAKLKTGTKSAKTQAWENLGTDFLTRFAYRYRELLEHIAVGEELNASCLEFMNRYERMLEYFRPKLIRSQVFNEHSFQQLEALSKTLNQLSNARTKNPIKVIDGEGELIENERALQELVQGSSRPTGKAD